MGKATFAQMFYLLIKGELPDRNTSRLLDMMLVSSVDHGVTPPSTLAALTAASTGAPINGAIAAGILSINAHHGGAIEGCMRIILEVKEHSLREAISPENAAYRLVDDYREKRIKIHGFGHRIHTRDPRAVKLLSAAEDLYLSGEYIQILSFIHSALEKVLVKELAINVDGALAALLLELEIPAELANGFFIMARVPGLIAHIHEEWMLQKPMRTINTSLHRYTGKPERSITKAQL